MRIMAHARKKLLHAVRKHLSPNRYNGLDRWIVKGVKSRIGSSMSVWLYDLVRDCVGQLRRAGSGGTKRRDVPRCTHLALPNRRKQWVQAISGFYGPHRSPHGA
jgi:hypothetical protein